MDNTENIDIVEEQDQQGEPTPLCINCLQPVDPLHYYCPNCGEATGQLTQYIPFVNIPWQITVWGRMWRQVFSRETSIPGRLFRLIMIIWNVPLLLIGLFFIRSQKTKDQNLQQPEDDSKE